MDTLAVNLGERSYPILFGANLNSEIRARVSDLGAAGRKVAVITDVHVAAEQGPALGAMFGEAPVLALPAGAQAKTLGGFGRALAFLAAASYLRGVDHFQVPTTLLAMVDSSVGGKTGVNLAAGKNLAGAFHQPRGVYVATGLLATLPPREFAAGMAEVIKCGLLGDAALFGQLERAPLAPASPALAAVIRRCCAAKASLVEADERELAPADGRALLNLGHTFGHAIEQAAGYGAYLHGEAVGIGLCAASRLSERLGLIAAGDVARIEAVVAAHALPTRLLAPLALADLLAAAGRDKKVRGGARRFVVLTAIGSAATRGDVDPELVAASFRAVGAV